MTRVFGQYVDGASVAKVAKAVGVSQSTVSLYLNEIEEKIGCRVVRRLSEVAEAVKEDGSVLRAERTGGLRRASVRDFHSFRVTWVTLALSRIRENFTPALHRTTVVKSSAPFEWVRRTSSTSWRL
jgi:AcrR family transcriptional regulator